MVRAVVNKFEQARDEDTYCLAKTALEKLARINKLLEDSQLKAGEAKTQ